MRETQGAILFSLKRHRIRW